MVGCTISVEQAKIARERCAKLPVEIRLQDYRDLDEQFDRIVSVGMFEHVGTSNYQTFFSVANKCLKDDGIFIFSMLYNLCELARYDENCGPLNAPFKFAN